MACMPGAMPLDGVTARAAARGAVRRGARARSRRGAGASAPGETVYGTRVSLSSSWLASSGSWRATSIANVRGGSRAAGEFAWRGPRVSPQAARRRMMRPPGRRSGYGRQSGARTPAAPCRFRRRRGGTRRARGQVHVRGARLRARRRGPARRRRFEDRATRPHRRQHRPRPLLAQHQHRGRAPALAVPHGAHAAAARKRRWRSSGTTTSPPPTARWPARWARCRAPR